MNARIQTIPFHERLFCSLLILFCFIGLPAQAEPKQGLVAEVYRFALLDRLPDVSGMKPHAVRVSEQVSFKDLSAWPARKQIYIRWKGTITVENKGTYTFFTSSDDGSRLTVNGTPVVQNGGQHGEEEASGTIKLDPGSHSILIEYFQSGGGAAMHALWEPPGGEKELIPAAVLSHDPSLETVDTQNFTGGKKISTVYSMDYGPYLSLTTKMPRPQNNWVHKAKAVNLNKTHLNQKNTPGAMVFDTDLLRFAGGWTGGFMNLTGVEFDMAHGPQPKPAETPAFITPRLPGWSRDGSFEDPRSIPHGPVPESLGAYRGLYLHGRKVIFSYRVADCSILDVPALETRTPADDKSSPAQNMKVFTRTMRIGTTEESLNHLVHQGRGTGKILDGPVPMARLTIGNEALYFALTGDTDGLAWDIPGKEVWSTRLHRILLNVRPSDDPRTVKMMIWRGGADRLDAFKSFVTSTEPPVDPSGWTNGGPGRWEQEVQTNGTLGEENNAYTLDTLTVPYDNPYDARMRLGGVDFFPGGNRAAVCTWNGDVWTVSGIDEDLDTLTWDRVATGLHQSLGLKIVDGTVYTLGRDQITRLHDLNGDGEFDFYESFNDDVQVTQNFHEFAFDLKTDAEGNFYFSKAGSVPFGGRGFEKLVPHHGTILKVSPDGSDLEVYASGLRAPNGIGIGPDGQVTAGGQQGTYVPTSCIHYFTDDRRYGTVPSTANIEPKPDDYNPPLLWIPWNVDNSAGGQTWVRSDRWGPFSGRMLHFSYGKSRLFLVMKDPDQFQAAVVRFPLRFLSGMMRGRFNPADGQLYAVGLQGWQTNAIKTGAFQRVRYTGKQVYMPEKVDVTSNGLNVTFTCKLDPSSAGSPRNFLMEMWNVKWSSKYGSKEYWVTKPNKQGHEKIDVTGAKLTDDGKTVKLTIPDLQKATNYQLRYRLTARDGTRIEASKIYGTVHDMPSSNGETDNDANN